MVKLAAIAQAANKIIRSFVVNFESTGSSPV
jgi:hypothetical protein